MAQDNDDPDLLPLVVVAATLVATGTALSSTRLLFGLLAILAGFILLVPAIVRMVQRQRGQIDERTRGRLNVWAVVLVFGMMLAGGGATLSAVYPPMIGLGIAIGGGVLCCVGGWRLIVGSDWRD
ncbi:hypothetical protein P1J78_22820 [Psychromarinibacter sp. C21-152]|uniref:Uncharacterized protein n=1 Tax=Psychromarinibacter sediminicola TaxID=3033385 RepID=A0AAE3NU49_9RHOB|nr:hypothetical protein [Psychromarinibacter sediminicola]MDF0603568.1 hypothetical protein [Psychromarinibacter sediminicola]